MGVPSRPSQGMDRAEVQAYYGGDGGPAIYAQLWPGPRGVAVDGVGNLYIADRANQTDPQGRLFRCRSPPSQGGGHPGSAAAGSTGTAARRSMPSYTTPRGLAADGAGNVYIADTANDHRIRKVDSSGEPSLPSRARESTGSGGDGGRASRCSGKTPPRGVALDGVGNLYIADSGQPPDPGPKSPTPCRRLRSDLLLLPPSCRGSELANHDHLDQLLRRKR